MKRATLSFVLSVALFTTIYAQQQEVFTFVKSSILRLEKQAKYNDDGMDGKLLYSTPLMKKRMLGMFQIEDTSAIIDYNTGKYLRFLDILPTEKYEIISEIMGKKLDWQENLFLQNIRTKQKYVVMIYPLMEFRDYNNVGSELNGYGKLTKTCALELTNEEKIILGRYKLIIKNGKTNILTLVSIQNKYLTRGYFDENRVSIKDKIVYNKTLEALKVKQVRIEDINRYEDKDNKIKDRLTSLENDVLLNIESWTRNQVKIY